MLIMLCCTCVFPLPCREGASAASLASSECARLLASRAAWRQGLSAAELEDLDQMVAARRQVRRAGKPGGRILGRCCMSRTKCWLRGAKLDGRCAAMHAAGGRRGITKPACSWMTPGIK